MTTTTTVVGKVKAPDGTVVEGAEILARLNAFDYDEEFGYITSRRISTTTDANGEFSFELWPNTRGTEGTIYRIVINSPVNGVSTNFTATIPEQAQVELNDAADFDPVPPLSDAEQLVNDAKAFRDKAKAFATEAEDVEVEPGLFSALHYSAKAEDSATAASTSESNASTSESNAASSASAASTSASNAATSESNAASSASAAATSETNAETAETGAVSAKDDAVAAKNATENIFDTFDDRFLGSFSSAPTTDNDGNPIVAGAVYYDTTQQEVYFYNGATWDAPAAQAETSATNALASENAAATSESNAATSESNAANSETAAANSASAAATSESNAATSETNAASSASAAATSESNAATSESNAAASESAAATSESNAASSATSAATSESNAATSETNAANSASAAATSETNAANSASAASTSETNAQAAATDAETALDNFTDQYLGPKSSDPATDNDGDPLVTGAIYYNTTEGQLYIWDGSVWQDAAFSAEGTVLSFNGRDGVVTLQSADVTNALGYTPYDASNPDGYISDYTVTSADVTTALGYTPQDQASAYNSTDFDADFGNKSTDNLTEGTSNLYYTDTRVRNAVSASGDLSYDSSTGVFSITATERALIQTPINESPADGTTGTTLTPQLEASPYRSLYGVAMVSAQWQISEVQDFATTVVDETVAGTSTTFTPSSNLSTLTNHYWRVRYTDNDGNVSDFSDATEFTTADTFVDTPTISVSGSPSNISPQPTISTSAFSVTNGSDTHISTDWEVIETATNNVVFESANDSSNLTSIDLPAGTLDTNSEYKFRARHRGSSLGASAFGEVIETTADIFTDQPTITSPTDGETDISEQPIIESSAFDTVNGSDTHVASQWVITRTSDGVDVFDSGEDTSNLESIQVPADILDEGDENYTVKVRHKGDTYGLSGFSPDSSFTTSSAFLDPNVDPIGTAGEGGFYAGKVVSDVDGLTYAIIVSDGDGDTDRTGAGGKDWRITETALTEAQTLSDGKSVMDHIVNNETLSNFLAHEWIQNTLNSGSGLNGYTDWYLPARDELELVYRHFKPTTQDNDNSTRLSSGFGGDGATYGTNNSSDPNGSGYTLSDPSQTTVTSFQDGGADYLTASNYWSTTEYDATDNWFQNFSSGYQTPTGKDGGNRVRAVRRVQV